MMTLRERITRGVPRGTVTSIGGVAGKSICGISIFMGGIERTFTEGTTIRLVPSDPGLNKAWVGFFSRGYALFAFCGFGGVFAARPRRFYSARFFFLTEARPPNPQKTPKTPKKNPNQGFFKAG